MSNVKYMEIALSEALKSLNTNDVPVGAIIVKDGTIIGRGYNMREMGKNAILHAEIVAIEDACKTLGSWRLDGCTIYVTLEPCAMCAGAILNANIDMVVFGAYEEKTGAVGSVFNLFYDYKYANKVKFFGGVLKDECAKLLNDFFNLKRGEVSKWS